MNTQSKMESRGSNLCEVCGCVYHWEMFFHNHLRDVHGIPTKSRKRKRTSLGKKNISLLEGYYGKVCVRPTLDEIENVAKFLDVKKESVYWWFVNRNKQKRRSVKSKLSLKRHGNEKGCVGGAPARPLEGGKGSKEKGVGRKHRNDSTPQPKV